MICLLRSARLPPVCLITPQPGDDTDDWLARLDRALAGGVSLAVLRAPGLAPGDYLALLQRTVRRCSASGARLLANPPPGTAAEDALATGVAGLHLSAARLRETAARPASARWLSASCHDEAELAAAEALGCDFALLSPVCSTLTHPDETPLGWARFGELVERVNLPVYALGGLARPDCMLAWQAGGQGIAAMRSLWPG